jgi:hypothetical protein
MKLETLVTDLIHLRTIHSPFDRIELMNSTDRCKKLQQSAKDE